MHDYEKQPVELTCPDCGRGIEGTYYDIYSRGKAECRKCGTKLEFDSHSKSVLKWALDDLEKAHENVEKTEGKVAKALDEAIDKADIIRKK